LEEQLYLTQMDVGAGPKGPIFFERLIVQKCMEEKMEKFENNRYSLQNVLRHVQDSIFTHVWSS
jgi:hypothetical protein